MTARVVFAAAVIAVLVVASYVAGAGELLEVLRW